MAERLADIRRVHEGPLFDVFRATVGGRDVAVKRIAPSDGARRCAALGAEWSHTNVTNIFHTRELGWTAREPLPGLAYHEALLDAEHAVIARVAADWNHPGARLARWRGDDELDAHEGARCLITPWCEGKSFAALTAAEQRAMFPRMLPALWRALAVCPHGDLKPDAFLLYPAGFFRILDPGVRIAGPREARPEPQLSFASSLVTTNAAHYLLVLPEHGPQAPRLRAPGGGLAHLLESQQRSLIEAHRDHLAATQAKQPEAPAAADVAALGALYFTVLTGAPLGSLLGAEPLWTGFWSDTGSRPDPDLVTSALAALAGVPRVLERAAVAPAEIRLCARLLMLELSDADVEPLAHAAASIAVA
jgi:hypothetical protein